jgi:redox-sensitive bicupin YhaK (pirin superfamily)
MSNVDLIIEERPADIGNFLVGRLLPFRGKRMVGPFIFIDHMGPAELGPDQNMDIGPHPHIGLSTLTYLFDGTITHRDSLGTHMDISPGAVNWMTAGKGIVHSERTPEGLRGQPKSLHGFQIWVALPDHLEEMEPEFHHTEASALPVWQEGDVAFKLITGDICGHRSPVPFHSPCYFLELKNENAATIELGDRLFGETALYVLDGGVKINGQEFGTKQLLVSKEPKLCTIELQPGSTVYIFGGEPFETERFIFWNFVSSDKERIEKAKSDWKAQLFPKVPNETGYIPLPELNQRH